MKHLAMAAAYSSLVAISIFPFQYSNLSHFNTRTVGAIKTGKGRQALYGKETTHQK